LNTCKENFSQASYTTDVTFYQLTGIKIYLK